jgi:hypothetical protein
MNTIKHWINISLAILIALPAVMLLILWVLFQKPIPINPEHLPLNK